MVLQSLHCLRTGGNDEHAAADAGELHGEAAAGGGFAHATLTAHKYPFERRLIEYVAQSWVGGACKVGHRGSITELGSSVMRAICVFVCVVLL